MNDQLRGQLQEAGLPEEFAALWDWVHAAVERMVEKSQTPGEPKPWALLMSKMPGVHTWSVCVEDRITLDVLDDWLVRTADTPIDVLARLALAIHRGKPGT